MTPYNPITDTDSYKILGHYGMLPEGVTRTFSYCESRGGRYPEHVFFGLQPWLIRLASTPITEAMVLEAEDLAMKHGGSFNKEGWMTIVNELGGRLPVEIKAVREGTIVPARNVLVTVENTDPRFPWLPGYLETALLRQVWYSTTIATRAWRMKQGIQKVFEQTSDNLDGLDFALHDFSARGCSSSEANLLGATAHLTSFKGTDSFDALRYAKQYYGSGTAGFSVPATEHSIMCSWGKLAEVEAVREIIRRFGGPGKTVSIVADTYNVFQMANLCAALADWIKSTGTTLAFRPDSGKPLDVLPHVLRSLEKGFGSIANSKGYKVLDGVKVLWGDGIDEDSYLKPFEVAIMHGYAADNIIIGSGGGLMQANTDRDTGKFAFKASAIEEYGVWKGIAKDPITDPGKKSKRGRLKLIDTEDGLQTVNEADDGDCVMNVVFRDGKLTNGVESLDAIRRRILRSEE